MALICVCTCAGARGGQQAGETAAETVRSTVKNRDLWEAEERRARREVDDSRRKLVCSLFSGVQYDDNITLESMGVDAGEADRTDWKQILAFRADFRAVNTEEHVLGLRYDLYQSFIDINDELQLTGHTFTGYHTLMRAPHVFYTPLSVSRYNLYWHRYLDVYALKPTLFVEQSAHAAGVIRLEWSHYNYFHVAGNDFDENDRDANVFSIGGEEWLIFGDRGQHRLEGAYTLRREIAREEEWGSLSHKVRLGLGSQLPWGDLSVGGFVSYEGKDYGRENPAFRKKQEEDIMTYGLTLRRPLWKDASVSLSYLFTDNESNVTSQDYERSQFTLGVTVQF